MLSKSFDLKMNAKTTDSEPVDEWDKIPEEVPTIKVGEDDDEEESEEEESDEEEEESDEEEEEIPAYDTFSEMFFDAVEGTIQYKILENLTISGYDNAIGSQRMIRGIVESGRSAVVGAPTGSGKTLAQVLAALLRCNPKFRKKNQALFLAPTKELAQATYNTIVTLIKNTGLTAALHIGVGTDDGRSRCYYNNHGSKLECIGNESIIVATPGRALSLFFGKDRQNKLNGVAVAIHNFGETEEEVATFRRNISRIPGSTYVSNGFCYRRVRGNIKDVHTIVIDEADIMLDSIESKNGQASFEEIVYTMFNGASSSLIMYLFSATILDSPGIQCFMDRFNDGEGCFASESPLFLDCQIEGIGDTVKQYYIKVDEEHKKDALFDLVSRSNHNVFIFCDGIAVVRSICKFLNDNNIPTGMCYSTMSNYERNSAFTSFRNGDIKVIVSAGGLGRGIDVPKAGLVVNYDCVTQKNIDEHVHRSGRTGRMSRDGVCVTFVNDAGCPISDHPPIIISLMDLLKTKFIRLTHFDDLVLY